jgi:hypothetical protein
MQLRNTVFGDEVQIAMRPPVQEGERCFEAAIQCLPNSLWFLRNRLIVHVRGMFSPDRSKP